MGIWFDGTHVGTKQMCNDCSWFLLQVFCPTVGIQKVLKSISTNTGVAPQCSITFAEETQVNAGTSTSSPALIPRAFKITCSAVVQLVVAKLF